MLRRLATLIVAILLTVLTMRTSTPPGATFASEPPPPPENENSLPLLPDLPGEEDTLIPPEPLTWQGTPLAPELAPTVLSIATGNRHTCAVLLGGRVMCWGDNQIGQLGNGTLEPRLLPTEVSGLFSGATQVAAGDFHACVITAGGGVKCWGGNWFGQLGDGTYIDHPTPVDVSGLTSGVVALAAGGAHTCALTSSGGVKCWGANPYGQLGNSSNIDSAIPVDVWDLGSGVRAISAGSAHTCAITTGNVALCWGYNEYGQLGHDFPFSIYHPRPVAGLQANVLSLAAGASHTCAVVGTGSGGVKCWGNNKEGQIGNGTDGNYLTTPVDTAGLSSGVLSVAAGEQHTCAVGLTNTWCWGDNKWGQLGNLGTLDSPIPVPISGQGVDLRELDTHGNHTCAILSSPSGGARCWGLNEDGQLGVGRNRLRRYAAPVSAFPGVAAQLSAGFEHTCAIAPGGIAYCWGDNRNGQLGIGNRIDRFVATPVSNLRDVYRLAAGYQHTCALTTGGVVKCWGDNNFGQIGDGNTVARRTLPVEVARLGNAVSSIGGGGHHTCATVLTAWPPSLGGALYCWGANWYGQLGDGSSTNRNQPVAVVGLPEGAVAAAGGLYHTCALTGGGGVKCWGANWQGQLGDGTTNTRLYPVYVSNLTSGIASLATGAFHTCALTTAGSVKCWGDNSSGQLGNGTQTSSPLPIDVPGMTSGVSAIAARGSTTCAMRTGGDVYCWGDNYNGQIGDGKTGEVQTNPTRVSTLTLEARAISAGWGHVCAALNSGIQCWGNNFHGSLGDGTAGYSADPLDVVWLSYNLFLPVGQK